MRSGMGFGLGPSVALVETDEGCVEGLARGLGLLNQLVSGRKNFAIRCDPNSGGQGSAVKIDSQNKPNWGSRADVHCSNGRLRVGDVESKQHRAADSDVSSRHSRIRGKQPPAPRTRG